MNNNQKKDLCLALMRADSEAEVVQILTKAGLWDNKRVWRLYGDRENNFSTIGNQQNRPDAALVEKLVNSVDARLMHECLACGISPESKAAPQNILEAVARFFETGTSASVYSGQISAWDNEKRREVARGITLAATGMKVQDGDPCITIADAGEGHDLGEVLPPTPAPRPSEGRGWPTGRVRVEAARKSSRAGGTSSASIAAMPGI
jgi:hypothetical protein